MALLLNKLAINTVTKVPVRYKNGPNHWATLRKKKTAKDKALQYFDDFYAKVYGSTWPHIRAALLSENRKYVAVTNNFSDTDKTKTALKLCGAMNIRSIYESQQETLHQEPSLRKSQSDSTEGPLIIDAIESQARLSEIQSLYPPNSAAPLLSYSDDNTQNTNIAKESLKPVQLRSINTDQDCTTIKSGRILDSTSDLTALNEFIPATKLKGMEDWIPESEHYSFYQKGSDFTVHILKEDSLKIPTYLDVYTFGEGDNSTFPAPKQGSTGLLDYYLFDGGSLLPVLALDIHGGDAVLDMCAAPGGKTLAILQTLMPKLMVANDATESRVKRIENVLQQYTATISNLNDNIHITQQDARWIDDVGVFNKILVDVPCTTDRHNLHTDENNIFKTTRIKERIKLPEVQAEILTNALRIVCVGGTVVYSTCTLSPVQNDGVVQFALKKAWEENGSVMVVKDLSEALEPFECLYKFGDFGLRYGHIVIPTRRKNWGPTYFCKIVKLK